MLNRRSSGRDKMVQVKDTLAIGRMARASKKSESGYYSTWIAVTTRRRRVVPIGVHVMSVRR